MTIMSHILAQQGVSALGHYKSISLCSTLPFCAVQMFGIGWFLQDQQARSASKISKQDQKARSASKQASKISKQAGSASKISKQASKQAGRQAGRQASKISKQDQQASKLASYLAS